MSRKIGSYKPKPLGGSDLQLTVSSESDASNPYIISPAQEHINLNEWISLNKESIISTLHRTGGILFRGFDINSVEKFEEVTATLTPDLLNYNERSTPRSEVKSKTSRIYTSTEYPPQYEIQQHNENSYASKWPMKIWFYSVKEAVSGGETPIADSRKVYSILDEKIIRKFSEKGVMYVRNFNAEIDLPWQEAFQTEDKSVVERYCQSNGITYEWLDSNRLRTKSVRPALAKHPVTKEILWFNQAHLFHVSSVPDGVGESLIQSYGEENLPRNCYFGDGESIDQSILDGIREVYDSVKISFPWKRSDLLLLDNMLMTHGRLSFEGERKVLVAMAEPIDSTGL